MRRREFIAAIGGAAALWPFPADAQQTAGMRRIAVLVSGGGPEAEHVIAAFRQRLDDLGWHERRNAQIEVRWGQSDNSVARRHAAELSAMAPHVFFATNTQMVQLIQSNTRTIPIVFVQVPDPVGSGFVESLAHPGGNITGFTSFDPSIAGKWLQLLKTVAPRLKRVALILHASNPTGPGFRQMIEAGAQTLALELRTYELKDGPRIEPAVEMFSKEGEGGGLIVLPSALATLFRDRIIALAAQKHLPAVYPYNEFPIAGGLMSYGFDRVMPYQQAAIYVHRILMGEKPADLPVQTPTKFELIVNLKTAKALGLEISPNFLTLADEVIE